MARILTLLALCLNLPEVFAIVGFDCGGRHLNITTLSLLEIGECSYQPKPVNATDVHIQLLQAAEYSNAHVMQCKVDISRTVYYCGMHSHVSVVRNGRADYLLEISQRRCLMLHSEGSISLGNGILIDNVKVNATTSRSITMAGSLSDNGKCQGTQYSDNYGTWENVVVQASIKITLKESYAPVRLGQNKIILRSGTTCKFTDGQCIDVDEGMTFWSPAPPSRCNFEAYDILYGGIATKLTDSDPQNPEVYTVQSKNVVFALTKTSQVHICGYHLVRTEHPRLYILEGSLDTPVQPVQVENLDLFTYVNSKFVYVEKHIRTQINTLYEDVLTHRCNLERQVLSNSITMATQSPDEFAYNLMNAPGYMAVAAGEVVHLIKCSPVEVQMRRSNVCYNELPVTYGNNTYFLSPKSRILLKTGSVRECSQIIPTMYFLNDQWIKFLPAPVISNSPQQLKPQSAPTWRYSSAGSLATSGIYSPEDLDNLRDHIMFAKEQPAIINTIVRGATGKTGSFDDGDSILYNLMDEKTLSLIAESTTEKIWNGLLTFGSVSSALIAVYVIYQAIVTIINTIVQGYSLHNVYGCTVHLCAAISSGITSLLLMRKRINFNGSTNTYRGQNNGLDSILSHISSPNNDTVITMQPETENNAMNLSDHYTKNTSQAPRVTPRGCGAADHILRKQIRQSACRLERITEDINEARNDATCNASTSTQSTLL